MGDHRNRTATAAKPQFYTSSPFRNRSWCVDMYLRPSVKQKKPSVKSRIDLLDLLLWSLVAAVSLAEIWRTRASLAGGLVWPADSPRRPCPTDLAILVAVILVVLQISSSLWPADLAVHVRPCPSWWPHGARHPCPASPRHPCPADLVHPGGPMDSPSLSIHVPIRASGPSVRASGPPVRASGPPARPG
jgi:hypothetical protein